MKTLGEQIKTARLQRHLSQSALARQVGCKQSALSMFEGGRSTALSAQVIGKICDTLGLLPPTAAELSAEDETLRNRLQHGERVFCPNPQCPCNLPMTLGNRVILVPKAHHATTGEIHCGWCGEVLERRCPECGAAINPGAFCAQCGSAYLADVPETADPRRVAQSERILAWSEA
ncbi:MAG: helix-turn-helix domain-containing protein [Kiritimatiellae bacterium]|nr:helix-turn-helix domain-containing protein [Kiritimatiellia bacterium]